MSLGLDVAMLARIEADRIYALVLPEAQDQEAEGMVTVPLPFLANVLKTGQKMEAFAPTYIRMGLDKLTQTAKIRRLRRKADVPKESLAFMAAALRIAADSADGRTP